MVPFSTHLYTVAYMGGGGGGSVAGKLGGSPVGGGCVHGTVMCSSRRYIDCSCMYCTVISLVPRPAVQYMINKCAPY